MINSSVSTVSASIANCDVHQHRPAYMSQHRQTHATIKMRLNQGRIPRLLYQRGQEAAHSPDVASQKQSYKAYLVTLFHKIGTPGTSSISISVRFTRSAAADMLRAARAASVRRGSPNCSHGKFPVKSGVGLAPNCISMRTAAILQHDTAKCKGVVKLPSSVRY